MRAYLTLGLALHALCIIGGCKGEEPAPAGPEADEAKKMGATYAPDAPVDQPTGAPAIPASLPYGLLLAFSQFELVDGKPEIDRTCLGVGRTTECGACPREDFTCCQKLHVDLESNHRFPLHVRRSPGGVGANRCAVDTRHWFRATVARKNAVR